MSKFIDLQVNRDLLNPKFESYRLSVAPLKIDSQSLQDEVLEVKLGSECFSFLHVSHVAQLNYLYNDPYFKQLVFYIDIQGNINCVEILKSNLLEKPKSVWKISKTEENQLITLCFLNEEFACVCDGIGTVYLLQTFERSSLITWKLLETIILTDHNIFQAPVRLLTSKFEKQLNQFDFLLSHIQRNETEDFVCILSWFTLVNQESWQVQRVRCLSGKSLPNYVNFDNDELPHLCVISEKEFQFHFDSKGNLNSGETKKEEPQILYSYLQTLEDVTVRFKLPLHIRKYDIYVNCRTANIDISINDQNLVSGEFRQMVESDSSCWTLKKEKDHQLLEIVVFKVDKGCVWKELLKGDKQGVEIINPELCEEIHQRLKHLTSDSEVKSEDNPLRQGVFNSLELEDCDALGENHTFYRFNGNTHKQTHSANLGGYQWLFSISSTNQLSYFVNRHDVDALVWQLVSNTSSKEFQIQHVATFAALGYVQASKQNKRLMTAPEDFSYAVIADSSRHVYIYQQPSNENFIKNRKTGEKISTNANQFVINLNDCDALLGIQAMTDSLIVLSNSKIFNIRLNTGN